MTFDAKFDEFLANLDEDKSPYYRQGAIMKRPKMPKLEQEDREIASFNPFYYFYDGNPL
jgi:hypothetical protein